MSKKSHWENIYRTKTPNEVSWYQTHAHYSLQFIHNTGIQKTGHIIDVGGGTSTLVDDLLADGYERISVLDVSSTALQLKRTRLPLERSRSSFIVTAAWNEKTQRIECLCIKTASIPIL